MIVHMGMTPIQITIDERLLRRLNRDPEAKRHGRSALVRRAIDEYLRRKRDREIADSYRRAYEEQAPFPDAFGPWPPEPSWSDE
jgi:metal-responsive CopG/Arc/MetJ family transcriptional regulator